MRIYKLNVLIVIQKGVLYFDNGIAGHSKKCRFVDQKIKITFLGSGRLFSSWFKICLQWSVRSLCLFAIQTSKITFKIKIAVPRICMASFCLKKLVRYSPFPILGHWSIAVSVCGHGDKGNNGKNSNKPDRKWAGNQN